MDIINGAHAEVNQPFGLSGTLLTLKVDELGVVPLQDEVEVLPPLLSFAWQEHRGRAQRTFVFSVETFIQDLNKSKYLF